MHGPRSSPKGELIDIGAFIRTGSWEKYHSKYKQELQGMAVAMIPAHRFNADMSLTAPC